MPRFFLAPHLWQSSTFLDEEESRHASQVLRLRIGDEIEVFDGAGRRATAEITATAKNQVQIQLAPAEQSVPTQPRITLVQAIPKGKTFEWIIEKAVELGVSEVIPLISRHTVVQYDASEAVKKAAKWQRVALESCKQCGQDHLPIIREPISWASWISSVHRGLCIMASLVEGAGRLRLLMEKHQPITEATILIGPEGDFSAEETSQALAHGFQPVTLGRIILRAETAAIFALSSLRCFEMED